MTRCWNISCVQVLQIVHAIITCHAISCHYMRYFVAFSIKDHFCLTYKAPFFFLFNLFLSILYACRYFFVIKYKRLNIEAMVLSTISLRIEYNVLFTCFFLQSPQNSHRLNSILSLVFGVLLSPR